MQVEVVLNRDGGTLKTVDLEALSDTIRFEFSKGSHTANIRICSGNDLQAVLKAAAESPGINCILAGGGDGTISCAAGICRNHDKILGVLPAGTMNLFARTLAISLNLEEAITQLATGQVAMADVSTANDQVFLHQFSVGMQPKVIRERSQLTYKSRIGKMFASVKAILMTLNNPPSFLAEVTLDDNSKTTRTLSMLAVSNNPHSEGHMPYSDTYDAGIMGVFSAGNISGAENAKLMTDLFLGSWSNNTNLSVETGRKIKLHFPHRKKRDACVIDGEMLKLEDTVTLEIQPKSLKVIVPASPKLQRP